MTNGRTIDLNADLGEGFPYDKSLLDIVTSANVCCAAHAGSPEETFRCAALAAERGVRIGAHIGYADRANFGRVAVSLSAGELECSLARQLALCREAAEAAGAGVAYVKPHGALYHAAVRDRDSARAIVKLAANHSLSLLHLRGSVMQEIAKAAGVTFHCEGFADRRYLADGRLTPRSASASTLEEPSEVVAQSLALARGDRLGAVDSICLHGDTRGALRLAREISTGLSEAGVVLRRPPSPDLQPA